MKLGLYSVALVCEESGGTCSVGVLVFCIFLLCLPGCYCSRLCCLSAWGVGYGSCDLGSILFCIRGFWMVLRCFHSGLWILLGISAVFSGVCSGRLVLGPYLSLSL